MKNQIETINNTIVQLNINNKCFDNITKLSKVISKTTQPIIDYVDRINSYTKIKTNAFDSIQHFNALTIVLSNLSETIKQIDLEDFKLLTKSISNFAKENSLNTKITTQNEINYDVTAQELQLIPKQIAENNISTRKKRCLLNRFILLISKIGISGLLSIILFVCQPFYNNLFNVTPQQVVINESMKEIEQIREEEKITQEMRVIIKKTYIYESKKLNRIIEQLEIGDIVIIEENNNTLLKVRNYQTGTIGYIRKKYAKKNN